MSWFSKKKILPSEETYAATHAETYCARSLSLRTVSSGDALYYDPLERSIRRLPAHLASLFSGLGRWMTEDEHVQHILWESAGDEKDAREAFHEILSMGLLISKTEFLETLRSLPPATSNSKPVGVTSFLWCTRDRPQSLVGSVSSFLESNPAPNTAPQGADRRRVLIFDDSPTDDTRNAVNHSWGDRVGIIDSKEKAAFTANLRDVLEDAVRDVPPAVLDFAMNGDYGADRNVSLLMTAGEYIISTDDDVYNSFGIPPALTAEHEKYLGRNVSALVTSAFAASAGLPSTIEIAASEPLLLDSLLRRDGHIAITSLGMTGDSGIVSARHLHRTASHPRVTRDESFMTAHIGLDNRTLVPPFFPCFHNSDGLFALTLLHLDPTAFICHLPLGAFHDPIEAPSFPGESPTSWRPSVSETLMALTKSISFSPGTEDVETRMRRLGTGLKRLANLPENEFRRHLGKTMLPTVAAYLENLLDLLDLYDEKPSEWAVGVHKMISFIETHVEDEDYFIPLEISVATEPQKAAAFQNHLREYGLLLESWPTIWKAAKRLNTEGISKTDNC